MYIYLPSDNCVSFLCDCFMYNTTIRATMIIIMKNNIPPPAAPIVVKDNPLLLLISVAVNKKDQSMLYHS